MTDIVLVPVTGGSNLSAINSNFDKIEEAINTDILHLKGGNNVMKQDLDLNGHQLLNHETDLNDPDSLINVGDADARYYNVSGDALAGNMNAAGNKILNLPVANAPHEPMRKNEVDAANAAQDAVTAANFSKTIRTPEAIPTLGNAASRANKLLGFDGGGNPAVFGVGGGPVTDADQVLWSRNSLDEAITTVHKMLDGQYVNVWEFASLATGYTPGGDPNTWDWAPAFQAAVDTNLPVVFPTGSYRWESTVTFTRANSFYGYGIRNTILNYRGAAGTFGFSHAFTGDGSDQWPGRVQWEAMTIRGDGTLELGTNATVSGIKCSDNSGNLINIPYYSVRRVQFEGLVTGIELEGYAHIFEDCWAEKCVTGYDLTHPEQGAMHDCWANYCSTGLAINKRKLKFGHRLIITGGAYQRCNVGIDAWNFDELEINTYFELNNVADLRCGDPADPTNYTKGCKNVNFRMNSSGLTDPDAIGCAQFYATVGVEGHFVATVDEPGRFQPNVFANGFSKFLDISFNRERVFSTNPWVFSGEAVRRSIAHPIGSHAALNTSTLGSGWTNVSGRETRYYKLNMETVRLTGAVQTDDTGNATITTLPDGYRPVNTQTYSVPRFDTVGAVYLTTPAIIEIATSGAITFANIGNNQRVFLDGITFRTSSA